MWAFVARHPHECDARFLRKTGAARAGRWSELRKVAVDLGECSIADDFDGGAAGEQVRDFQVVRDVVTAPAQPEEFGKDAVLELGTIDEVMTVDAPESTVVSAGFTLAVAAKLQLVFQPAPVRRSEVGEVG